MTEPLYDAHLIEAAGSSPVELHEATVARIIADLTRTEPGQVFQHQLILGRWGMGKTHLLCRLRQAIEASVKGWRAVLLALARCTVPIGSGGLAEAMGWEARTVAMQLGRLSKRGVVEKVPMRVTGYRLTDRLLGLWVLSQSEAGRERLVGLLEVTREAV